MTEKDKKMTGMKKCRLSFVLPLLEKCLENAREKSKAFMLRQPWKFKWLLPISNGSSFSMIGDKKTKPNVQTMTTYAQVRSGNTVDSTLHT
jgi:hypothetical protein